MDYQTLTAIEANEIDNEAAVWNMAVVGLGGRKMNADPFPDVLNPGRDLDHLYPENLHHKILFAPVTIIKGAV